MVAITRSVGGLWVKKRPAVLPGTSSSVVETIPMTGFKSLDYIVTIWNSTEDKTKSLHLKITQDASGLKSMIRDKLGTNIDFDLSEAIVSGNMELTLTNNETFSLNIEMARLKLGA